MLEKARKLTKLMRCGLFRRGLRLGVAATVEHTGFLKAVHFDSLIDVGANKGQFALAARAYQPEAQIFSFEPLDAEAQRYLKLFRSDGKAKLFRCALGAESGAFTIHISRRRDSSSLLRIGKMQTESYANTEEIGVQTVPVHRLDATLSAADLQGAVLLKMDVQGYELEVLKGATGLFDIINDIYVELSFVQLYEDQPLASTVVHWLDDEGFELAGVYHTASRGDGLMLQADFHFRKA